MHSLISLASRVGGGVLRDERKNRMAGIKRKDIASYMTKEFFALVDTYARIKQYGWPQGKGSLAEPRALLELVTLFDDEKAHFKAFAEK